MFFAIAALFIMAGIAVAVSMGIPWWPAGIVATLWMWGGAALAFAHLERWLRK